MLSFKSKWSEVIALGFLGGRLDHHQAVLQELHRFIQRKKLKGTLVSLLSPELRVYGLSSQTVKRLKLDQVKKRQIVSVFPLSSLVKGLSFHGVKYPVKKEILTFGSRGLSNEVTNPRQCEISFVNGQILVMVN